MAAGWTRRGWEVLKGVDPVPMKAQYLGRSAVEVLEILVQKLRPVAARRVAPGLGSLEALEVSEE